MKTREDGWVYFIQEDGGGPIKIGFANDVIERMGQLQTGNHRQLLLLAFAPGDSKLEAALQRIQKKRGGHVRGEWFDDCEETQAVIADCRRDAEAGFPFLKHTDSRLRGVCIGRMLCEVDVAIAHTKKLKDNPDAEEVLRDMARRATAAKEQG